MPKRKYNKIKREEIIKHQWTIIERGYQTKRARYQPGSHVFELADTDFSDQVIYISLKAIPLMIKVMQEIEIKAKEERKCLKV